MEAMIRILYRDANVSQKKGEKNMKKKIMAAFAVFAAALLLSFAALAQVSALSWGVMEPIEARPNQKLALRSGRHVLLHLRYF